MQEYTQKPTSYLCGNMYETPYIRIKIEERYFLNYYIHVALIHNRIAAMYHVFIFIGGGNWSSPVCFQRTGLRLALFG